MMTPIAYTAKTVTTKEGLLADAEAIRRRGYSCSDEEHDESVLGFAVPIFEDGVCRYTLSIAAPAFRWPKAKQTKLISALRQAAAEISSALSGN